MARKLFLLTAFLFAVGYAAADEPKKADPAKPETKPDDAPAAKGKAAKVDKAKLFEKLDANADGKISKDEFTKWTDGIKEKLKEKGGKGEKIADAMTGKMFEKMDANADGEVSKDEFEKFELPAAAGRLKKADK